MNNLYIGENNIRDLNICNTKGIALSGVLSKNKTILFCNGCGNTRR